MMPLILHIDTATSHASVSLARNGIVLEQRLNAQTMDHAAWIHSAISDMLQQGAFQIRDISAVAVVAGPGSYTGIRVGMATAKGICYSQSIPLICLNTLKLMALAVAGEVLSPALICPMLDARRMEVFTALYDNQLQERLPPCAMVLETDSFSSWLAQQPVVFSGNGSIKWKQLVRHEHALFTDTAYTPGQIASLALEHFRQQDFAELAYTEPVYLKSFYTHPKKTTG